MKVELVTWTELPSVVARAYAIRHGDEGTPELAVALDFLAGGGITELNREMQPRRTEGYAESMRLGEWWSTPDPVCISPDGCILNGQHRLLAAMQLARQRRSVPDATRDAEFVVVWDVTEKAALLMDESRRTEQDRRRIAMRYAVRPQPTPAPRFNLVDSSDGAQGSAS